MEQRNDGIVNISWDGNRRAIGDGMGRDRIEQPPVRGTLTDGVRALAAEAGTPGP